MSALQEVREGGGPRLALEDARVERLEGVHQQVLNQQVYLVVYVLPLSPHLQCNTADPQDPAAH